MFALLVYTIIVFRAATQSITLDEADSFNNFANEHAFYPSSGNHVLNSLLARHIIPIFGLSQFTVRLPALLGAAVYLFAAGSIVQRIARNRQLLGFAILTLNPFFLDYLIAARGYALALGFLAAAIALSLKILEEEEKTNLRAAAAISVCAAFAIAANFSFAFTIISTIAAFLLTLILTKKHWLKTAAATVIPGTVVGLALVGQTLRDFPRSQLYYGAETWLEMWKEMLEAVFPHQNLQVPTFEPILTAVHHAAYLIVIPIAIGLWAARTWPIRFIWLALGFTLTVHGLAHSFQGLLLPMDRTSIFIAFFLTLIAIYAAANAPHKLARRISTAILCAALAIFTLAFRTNYFRIWDFDLDIGRGFQAFVQYAKENPTTTAGCTWRYGGAYNFYRAASNAPVPKCDFIDQDAPPPEDAYFLHVPGQAEFIAKARLQIVYQGPVSGLTVAVAPRSTQ